MTKRSDQYLDLKPEQWALVEEVCKVLETFKVATTYLQYEHNASISCVLPIIHGLDRGLQPSLEDSPVLKSFKTVISQQIKARWSLKELDVGSIDVYAVILDPRFKQSVLIHYQSKMKSHVVWLYFLHYSQIKKHCVDLASTKVLLVSCLDQRKLNQEPMSHGNELKSYMKEKPIPRNEDILSWWKANEHRYKQVANVPKEILCVPSTSAPAERLFSIAGLTINRLRSH